MSRIATRFAALAAAGRQALIPYITAGDPDLATTEALLHTLVANGADVIELGVPFSDPMADGPVIQRACERALATGTSLHDVLALVQRFRRQDAQTPVVLMGYLNPVEVMGYAAFAQAAATAGVDGVLTVDLPPEESHELNLALVEHGLDPIYLLAPTSRDERIRKVAAAARGYLYYVSLKGVTGSAALDTAEVARRVEHIKTLVDVPVGVGFGIRDAVTAAAVARVADAVVVGSALVSRVEQLAATPERMHAEIGGLLAEMRRAMDAGVATA